MEYSASLPDLWAFLFAFSSLIRHNGISEMKRVEVCQSTDCEDGVTPGMKVVLIQVKMLNFTKAMVKHEQREMKILCQYHGDH